LLVFAGVWPVLPVAVPAAALLPEPAAAPGAGLLPQPASSRLTAIAAASSFTPKRFMALRFALGLVREAVLTLLTKDSPPLRLLQIASLSPWLL
jgi:hypothetical protein